MEEHGTYVLESRGSRKVASREIIERGARTCAKWWADFLRHGAPMNNGDDTPNGLTAMILAKMIQDRESADLNEAHFAAFEEALTSLLLSEYEQSVSRAWFGRYIYCETDYGPDALLSHALESAGIMRASCLLPWKTSSCLRLEDGSVEVKCGYGAGLRVLEPLPA